MNRLRLKKTKMLDEAVLGHKRQGIVKVSLIFVLVFFIANTVCSMIQSVPLSIYSFSALFNNEEFHELVAKLEEGALTFEEYTDSATNLIIIIVSSLPFWITLISLFSTIAIIATSIIYCVKFEKRSISSMGIRKKDIAKEYLLGMGIGSVMFALSYLFAYLCGAVTISLNEYISPFIILFFLAFVIQGASEELLVRGYYMVSLARDTTIPISIGLSSVLFGLLHIANAGFTFIAFVNIILMGIFLGIYVFKRGDIWGACAIHTMWNFVQGNIFGSRVSGIVIEKSVFTTTYNEDLSFISGGAFGLEGSLCVTLILLVSILLVLLVGTKKSEISDFEIDE